MKIAFIGLGIMGSRMAQNLLNHQVDLTVYNRTPERANALVSQGAKLAHTPQEAVKDADLVISMLATPEAVAEVFFGDQGTLAGMKQDSIWVDASTVNPSFTKEAAREASKHAIRFMDGPVAGSKPQAEAAALVFFTGGDDVLIDQVEPYLLMMGKKVVRVGEVGKGASFKMIVNSMLAQSMALFSEAVLFGESMGISKSFLLDTLPNLPVAAPFTAFKAEGIKADNYEVQFPLQWMHKDLHLASVTAYEQKQPLFLNNVAKELYAQALKQGLGELDFSAIHKHLEQKQ